MKNYKILIEKNKRDFVISNPEGNHAVCAGLTENIDVTIKDMLDIIVLV